MIEFDWADNEETVAIWQFRKYWTSEQFYATNEHSSKMILTKNHSVNVIFDFRFSLQSPKNAMPLFSALFKKLPPNIDRIVVFATTSYWERLITAVLAGVETQHSVYFANNLEETYEFVGLHEG